MVAKRIFGQEEEEEGEGIKSSALEAKRPPRPLISAMREAMGAQCLHRNLPKLEPFLRRVVQEEVQNALHHHVHSASSRLTTYQRQPTVNRQYQLRFFNTLPQTIYTGSRIEAEGGVPVQITIIDSDSKLIITSSPLASAKVEILALDGDFGGENEWSEKDFVENIVRERDGKRPLLTGELIITLSNGVGYVNDATFTDNSSWIRSRKFRLGARVCLSRLTEGRVREAISEAFLVKDHRGESYKKHHPPSLNDEVWRLEKIGKDGAFHKRLAENMIYTVQDFLRNLVMDPRRLRSLLGNGMSNKIWEATLEHARECVPDDKLNSYSRGQGVILIFNSIFQLVGAIIDHLYHSVDELTASQKTIVNKLKELAYRNQNDIAELKLPADNLLPKPLPSIDAAICLPVSSWSEPHIPEVPSTHQGNQLEKKLIDELSAQQFGLLQQPGNVILEDLTQLKDIFGTQGPLPVQKFSSFQNYTFDGGQFFDVHFDDGQASAIMASEQQNVGYSSEFELWDHDKALCQTSDGAFGVDYAAQVPHRTARISSSRWVKLMAVLKWMAISRQLAARRAAVAAKRPRITEMGCPALTTMWTDATTPGC